MCIESLRTFGWDVHFESGFAQFADTGLVPGRIVQQNRQLYSIYTAHGELLADTSGKLRFNTWGREDLPAVGDWVAIRSRLDESRATIHAVLPRKSQFIRKVAGKRTEAQVIAANMDWVFVMTSLNQEFSARRLERYLVLAWESGALPVVVLSKADLCAHKESRIAAARVKAAGIPIHPISVFTGEGP